MYIKIIIAFSFIFISLFSVKAQEGDIFINELAWMGNASSSADEWIELFNNTNNGINLDSWSLKAKDGQPEIIFSGIITAQGYYLLERTNDETVSQKTANQIYSGSLGNMGEYLELFDSENNLVDSVNMSSGWSYGDNTTKKTMERIEQNIWQTSLNSGGSPGEKNVVNQTIISNGTTSLIDIQENNILTQEHTYKYSDVLINEIVADPADGDTEWVELFNNSGKTIDLRAWYIKEGSGAKTILKGAFDARKYFVIENPKGNLNNSGDEVLLFSPNNKLINDLVYGDWNDGNILDNAPQASDPMSIARINTRDSLNNKNDFKLSIKPTKGASNIILDKNNLSMGETDNYDFRQTLIVSEIFPNPSGNEKAGEFIELYNYGDRDINLFGWRLGDNSKNRFEFSRGDKIKAKAYLVLYRSDTGIALNNTGDSLNIYQPGNEESIYNLSYTKADEDFSFNNTKTEETENFYNKNFVTNNWTWSETISPGKKNIFRLVNHIPEIDFSFSEVLFVANPVLFDSSDTFDIDGDELTYHWNFGDEFENILQNPEHTYFNEGVYEVVLEVSDGENIVQTEKIIKIKNRIELSARIENSLKELNFGEDKIFITEILPNPDGDDLEGEFVEIYNANNFPVSLMNWILDDMDGGSKPYKITNNALIGAGEYYVINRTESRVILNNSYDQVRLIDTKEKVVDKIDYKKTINAKSYSKNKLGIWIWTDNISPGEKNVYIPDKADVSEETIPSIAIQAGDYYSLKTPREVQNHGAKQTVLAEGVVNSLPGMFSSQYFYIEGDGGVQIYSNKKDFPLLHIGDLVQVRGEISKINQESRIKTKTKGEIVIIDRNYTLTPLDLDGPINNEHLGKLVFVSGEIVKKDGNKFTLKRKTEEYIFEIKEGVDVDKADLNKGTKINLLGIVSSNKTGYMILPRLESDIEIIEETIEQEAGAVLGEFSDKEEWNLAQKDNKKRDYIFLIAIFFVATTLIYIYRKKVRT